ncbi:zinc transporter ZIP14 [Elysia marginata]|uniref:Zinc transporter ZIP14 n=1 Tax=Elysia marginata TaxID=1093978 RepID=A0AAV4HWN5_9GAST|nr:zinc transporter ZIP14 [Elysia marginata]
MDNTKPSGLMGLVPILVVTLFIYDVAALDGPQLQQVFSAAVAENVTSYSRLAQRLDGIVTTENKDEKPGAAATVVSSSSAVPSSSVYDVDCWTSPAKLSACLKLDQKCIPFKEIGERYGFYQSHSSNATNSSATSSNESWLSDAKVDQVAPALVYSVLTCWKDKVASPEEQNKDSHTDGDKDAKPSTEATWGYSLLFVTLINLCALTGAFVLPCMRLQSYKLVLIFMVALAVGTLVGSGLLFLIPEAFGIVHDDDNGYIWKASTIMGGVYLFYLTERFMRMINTHRENTQAKKKRDELATEGAITTSFRRLPVDNSIAGKDPSQLPPHLTSPGALCGSAYATHPSNSSSCVEFAALEGSREGSDEGIAVDPAARTQDGDDVEAAGTASNNGAHLPSPNQTEVEVKTTMNNGHGHHHHSHALGQQQEVAPVAYMIIFGDALHNFIDGLSIGSAFTQSIMTGVSVSVAVMCEELPHELGDFAILLNSGMPFRRALMYNFLSAMTCYAGTVIGIMLGENTQSHEWIFAIAGGMFLYISLVDMMPEMNLAAESAEGKAFGTTRLFLLQNVGLLAGFTIMLIMALYGGNIDFS